VRAELEETDENTEVQFSKKKKKNTEVPELHTR
jgi:hypothetical protein